MAKPSARTIRAASVSSDDPGGAGPLGAAGAEVGAEVAETGGGEERVAGGVRGDVAVGVPGEPVALALPEQARAPQLAALLEGVHVGADADQRQQRRARWRQKPSVRASCAREPPRPAPDREAGSP